MSKLKILYVTHEMTPYLELSQMAVNARELPQRMQERETDVRVFMPRFGVIKERKHRLHEVIRLSGINIPVGDEDNPLLIKVASLPAARMQIYFLDNDYYFSKRGYLTDEGKTELYADNAERVIFFNKGVIEIIHKLGWYPDIIHCQGWMCGMVPMYARTVPRNEQVFRNTRFIYTPYEDVFSESLGADFVSKAQVTGQDAEGFKYLENPVCSDFYRTGITFADGITLGSHEVGAELTKLSFDSGKPVLGFQEKGSENFAENHLELYRALLEQPVLEKQ